MARIHGRVLDSQGRPIPNAAVYVESAPVSLPDIAAITDEGGSFTLAVPSPGEYRIGARSDQRGRASTDVRVDAAGEDSRIELRLTVNGPTT